MGSFTNYLEQKWSEHLFRSTPYTPPATVYAALFTSDPGETGSTAGEPSGNNYSRVALTLPAATNYTIQNTSAITFPTPSGSWGTITHYGIMDAASGGNMLCFDDLPSGELVSSGDSVEFEASNFTVGGGRQCLSDYVIREMLDHTFRNSSYTAPSLYFGLFSTVPSLGGIGGTEISTGGYARKIVTYDQGATVNESDLAAEVFFRAVGVAWSVRGWGIWDASTSGNLIAFGSTATQPVSVSSSEYITFDAGTAGIVIE